MFDKKGCVALVKVTMNNDKKKLLFVMSNTENFLTR